MEKLSNELLHSILEFIQADRVVSIDRRAYLSVESFKAPSPPLPAQAQDVANFRLVCRRFAELGLSYQFSRVTTRFSAAGIARLERIATCPGIGPLVKKFSYMVPCFYLDGKDRLEELFHLHPSDFHTFDASHFIRKASEQKAIVSSQRDLHALVTAFSAFTCLQHVQILRLQDEPDRLLLEHLREDPDATSPLVELQWTPACVHAARTIGEALLTSGSPFTRFSGPMMSLDSALELQKAGPGQAMALARQLTCLELHFDESYHVDERMQALSHAFKDVFAAAKGMLAVHLGFPSRSPLGLPLERVFHHVHWERLRAFGIQAWRLDADEIIGLVRRHRRTLRGLRLRDVLLKEPSRWKDVLAVLRNEMDHLDWVSLRRIGYADRFDELVAGTVEILPSMQGGASESDDEEEFPTHLGADGDAEDVASHGAEVFGGDVHGSVGNGGGHGHSDGDHFNGEDFNDVHDNAEVNGGDDDDHDSGHDSDETADEHGPEAHELSMDPDTPSSVPWCNCNRRSHLATTGAETADELGDNGRDVPNWRRKMWEKWVLGRCPEHYH